MTRANQLLRLTHASHLFRWLRSAAFTTSGALFLIDLAMGLCFNIIVLVTVVEILGAPL